MRISAYRSQYENDRLVDRGPSLDPPDEPDFEDEIETELERLCANRQTVSDLIGDSDELIDLSNTIALASATFVERPTGIAQECLHRAAIDLGNTIREKLRPRAERRVAEVARYFRRGEPE